MRKTSFSRGASDSNFRASIMLTSGLGADIVVVCTHFPLWRVLSMESFQSSTSYESDKLARPTVISNSPGMQQSSALRPIVNGKVSDRKIVGVGKCVLVRVAIGGRGI